MLESQFTGESGSWWLLDAEFGSIAELRTALGESFGWMEPMWHKSPSNLRAVYKVVEANQLMTQLDDAKTEDDYTRWIRSLIQLNPSGQAPTLEEKPARSETSVPSDSGEESVRSGLQPSDQGSEAEMPTGNEVPSRKSIFKSKSETKPPDGAPDVSAAPDLSPMEQILMEGVLEIETVDAAVLKIYDNMHKRTGWKYQAGALDQVGTHYTKGGKTVGMCQSYREAFIAALKCYDLLRKSHPVDAVRNGQLDIKQNDNLAAQRFCTRQGLKLMGGSGLEGNVYLEIDGGAKALASGLNSIKKFVFSGHWTATVNGVVYDPIFYSIDENNVGTLLDIRYGEGNGRYIVDKEKASLFPDDEFGVAYIWISDWGRLTETMARMAELYEDNKQEVDDVVAGKKSTQGGTFSKGDRKCFASAKQLVKDRVADPLTFGLVTDAAVEDTLTRAEGKRYGPAVKQILALASM